MRKIRFLLFMIMALCASGMSAVESGGVVLAQPSDSAAVSKMLVGVSQFDSPGKMAAAAAEMLKAMKYADTARTDSAAGASVANLRAGDSMDFVSYVVALVKAARSPGAGWRDFLDAVENIKYRKGHNAGFASRMLYASDWIADNVYRGNVREITNYLPSPLSLTKTLDFYTRQRDAYPALADSAVFAAQRSFEDGMRAHKVPYVKRESAGKKDVVSQMADGDIIVILTKTPGLDAQDAGIIRFADGQPYLIHNSAAGGGVVAEPEPLVKFIKRNYPDAPGYRLIRIEE